MRCPFKFGNYDFEGAEDCIGSECGMHKLCGSNDTLAAENDVSVASVDANDSYAKLEEDWTEFYTTHERECLYQSDVGQFVFDLLDRQAAIIERECAFKLHEILGEIDE